MVGLVKMSNTSMNNEKTVLIVVPEQKFGNDSQNFDRNSCTLIDAMVNCALYTCLVKLRSNKLFSFPEIATYALLFCVYIFEQRILMILYNYCQLVIFNHYCGALFEFTLFLEYHNYV